MSRIFPRKGFPRRRLMKRDVATLQRFRELKFVVEELTDELQFHVGGSYFILMAHAGRMKSKVLWAPDCLPYNAGRHQASSMALAFKVQMKHLALTFPDRALEFATAEASI